MKILHIHFYLLMCCGAAERFTEKLVDLGGNVTLKCEVAVQEVYWFLMKPSEPPVFILRSFTRFPVDPYYRNTTFSKTFSVQSNSSLFIHNISTNELGVYYCIQIVTGSPPDISRGIRLYIRNDSAEHQTCEGEWRPNQTVYKCVSLWQSLFIIFGIINSLVIVSIVSCCGKTKSSNCDVKLQEVSGSQIWWPKAHNESSYTVVEFVPFQPVE